MHKCPWYQIWKLDLKMQMGAYYLYEWHRTILEPIMLPKNKANSIIQLKWNLSYYKKVLFHYKNTLTSLYILTERNVADCSNLVGAWHTKTGQLTVATPSFHSLLLIIMILFSFLPPLLGSPVFLNHLIKQGEINKIDTNSSLNLYF